MKTFFLENLSEPVHSYSRVPLVLGPPSMKAQRSAVLLGPAGVPQYCRGFDKEVSPSVHPGSHMASSCGGERIPESHDPHLPFLHSPIHDLPLYFSLSPNHFYHLIISLVELRKLPLPLSLFFSLCDQIEIMHRNREIEREKARHRKRLLEMASL